MSEKIIITCDRCGSTEGSPFKWFVLEALVRPLEFGSLKYPLHFCSRTCLAMWARADGPERERLLEGDATR